MSYLILDTETNGLNHRVNKVIEVGAVIADFNKDLGILEYVDSYQSLVFLETYLDEKITDLTGITVEDLSQAPKRHIVQEEWQNFINKYEITHILGHSLSFDTDFLKSNGFYLPDAYNLDTLDFAKIILLDAKALNLDYINNTYILDSYFPKPSTLNNLNHHRALFDAFLAAGLYNLIFQKIAESSRSTDFILALEYFIQQKTNLSEALETTQRLHDSNEITINILKKDISNSHKKIFTKLLEDDSLPEQISHIFTNLKDKDLVFKKIVLSIWFAVLNSNLLGKVSINGGFEKKFFDLILTSLGYKDELIANNYNLVSPEQIINDNKDLTTFNTSTLDIIDYLNLYSNLKSDCQQAIGLIKLEHVKLLSALRLLTKTAYYGLNRSSAQLEQTDLINTLDQYSNQLTTVYNTLKEKYSRTALEDEILQYLTHSKKILESKDLSFFFHDNDVKIYVSIEFNLVDYLSDLFKHANNIKTTLTPTEYLLLIEVLHLPGHENISYGEDIMLEEEGSILEALKNQDKCRIIFVGKSANLKTLPSKLKSANIEYIDLSNIGSATKILSKIENGYNGTVILSYKSIEFLSNFLHDNTNHIEFYFYGDIFLALTKSIKDLNTKGINQFEFDKKISKLYLKYLLNKLYFKFNQKTRFYKEL
jgi:DNA polymerase III epsilon subunit-like protein